MLKLFSGQNYYLEKKIPRKLLPGAISTLFDHIQPTRKRKNVKEQIENRKRAEEVII